MFACVAWTSSFGVAVIMSSPPAVPEVRVMDAAEDPAAAGSMTGAPMEAPVAKAAGPAGPPVPVMIPDEPNISGGGEGPPQDSGRRDPCSLVVIH